MRNLIRGLNAIENSTAGGLQCLLFRAHYWDKNDKNNEITRVS